MITVSPARFSRSDERVHQLSQIMSFELVHRRIYLLNITKCAAIKWRASGYPIQTPMLEFVSFTFSSLFLRRSFVSLFFFKHFQIKIKDGLRG